MLFGLFSVEQHFSLSSQKSADAAQKAELFRDYPIYF